MSKYTTVTFKRDVQLKRFVMKKDEAWRVRTNRMDSNGGFTLGGGFIIKSDYSVTGK